MAGAAVAHHRAKKDAEQQQAYDEAPAEEQALFTEDVVGWSPYATVSGLTALAELSALRDVAFSNVVLMFRGIDEVGNKAFAEWLIESDHTGPLVLGEEEVVGATGRPM